MPSSFYTLSSAPGAQNGDSDSPQRRNMASRTLSLSYTSSNSPGLSLSQPGSPSADLDDLGTLTNASTLSPVSLSQFAAHNSFAGSSVGGFGANKENSNYSWTMMILNKLPGAQKRKNKKNKKGSGSADGRPGNGNIVRNEFLFPAERSKGSYSHRPDSVVEEEITLKTLKRRDRNSSIIRKSLALDDDSFATAIAHRTGPDNPYPYSLTTGTGLDSSDRSAITSSSEGTSFRESGKGHHFKFTADDPAHVLWCDICGEAIFSLLYRAIRCDNCGYLCHENCRPGVGLDCPAELEKQLEQRLCQVDPEKLMQQLEMPTNNQRLWTDYCGQQNAGNQYTEPSPPFLTPPLTPSAFSGYDSTSEHAAEETSSSASSISIARDPLSRGTNNNDADDDGEEAILTPVSRRRQEKRRSQRPHFDFSSASFGNRVKREAIGQSELEESTGTTASLSEEQVQKWALRLMRSNSLYSKSPIMYEKSLTPGNLVGSAAGPKVTRDFHLTASMAFTSSGSFGDTATSASSSSSAASAGTLPTKLKAKDLEKRVLEYAKQNPQSDLKLVKKSSIGSVSSSISNDKAKSNNSLFNSLKRRGEEGVEFEGFLHVTMCLHRPISVANEVALDFSLESVHRNMSFERSKSENRTTFYLPYGSEHAVRCSSEDSTSTVVTKLLQKFHVADDPRKYVLFHDVINGHPDIPVTRRRVNESERPLYLALLFGAHKMNQNSDNLSKASSAIAGDNSKAVTGHSNSTPLMKHVFVLEENEQPDIQWDRFSEHELTMFLEILKLEEEQHIAMIREKYEKEKRKLQERLNLLSSYISANQESSPENDLQDLPIEDLEQNESES